MCAIVVLRKCYAESKIYKHTCNAKISHSAYSIKTPTCKIKYIWTGQKVKEIIYGRTHPGLLVGGLAIGLAWHLVFCWKGEVVCFSLCSLVLLNLFDMRLLLSRPSRELIGVHRRSPPPALHSYVYFRHSFLHNPLKHII